MSVLTEAFPTKLEVNGRKCQIYYDFRTVLHCNHIIEEKHQELAGEELVAMLSKFYKNEKRFTDAHVDKMFWFFSCGREKEKRIFQGRLPVLMISSHLILRRMRSLFMPAFYSNMGLICKNLICTGGSL